MILRRTFSKTLGAGAIRRTNTAPAAHATHGATTLEIILLQGRSLMHPLHQGGA